MSSSRALAQTEGRGRRRRTVGLEAALVRRGAGHKVVLFEAAGELGAHMNELYKYGIAIRHDSRLLATRRAANPLVAVVSNTCREDAEELEFDQIMTTPPCFSDTSRHGNRTARLPDRGDGETRNQRGPGIVGVDV